MEIYIADVLRQLEKERVQPAGLISMIGNVKWAALCAGAVVILASCSHAGGGPQSSPSTMTEGRASSAPTFSGPWAHELEQAYRESTNERFRAIIADGTVTMAEYSETQNLAQRCHEDNGFTGVHYEPLGGSSVDVRTDISEEKAAELYQQCEEDTGLIETEVWFHNLWLNPEHLDVSEGTRDCLVDAGLLEKGSSIDDMEQWFAQGGSGTRSADAERCATDPFGKRDAVPH